MIGQEPEPPDQHESRLSAREKWEAVALVAAGVVLVSGIGYGVLRLIGARRGASETPPGIVVTARPSVAILGFHNKAAAEENAWMDTASTEMLAQILGASGSIRVVSTGNVARVRSELSVLDPSAVTTDTMPRLRGMLDVDHLVFGTFETYDELGARKLRFNIQLTDTRGGLTSFLTLNGTETGFTDLVVDAGTQLHRKIVGSAMKGADAKAARAALPSNALAMQRLHEALALQRGFRRAESVDVWKQVVEADPMSPFIRWTAAEGLRFAGRGSDADAILQAIGTESRSLPAGLRARIDADRAGARNDWKSAIKALSAAFDANPDDPEFGIVLAAAQIRGGESAAALKTFDRLRSTQLAVASDPRIALAEVDAARAFGDGKRLQSATELAVGQAKAEGATWLLAQARLAEGRAALLEGDTGRGVEAFERAMRLFEHSRDRSGQVDALAGLAEALARKGDRDLASQRCSLAYAIAQQAGEPASGARARETCAATSRAAGDLAAAAESFAEAIRLWRESGDQAGLARALTGAARLDRLRGDANEGRSKADEARSTAERIHDLRATSDALALISMIRYSDGDLAAGVPLADEAVKAARGVEDGERMIRTLAVQGRLRFEQDDVAGARASWNEALKIAEERSNPAAAAMARLGLARALLDEGNAAAAEKEAGTAAEAARIAGDLDALTPALCIRSEALLALGRVDEARTVIEQAKAAAPAGSVARMRVEITASRIDGASPGDSATKAAEALRALAVALEKNGDAPLELEARLALGETALRAGQQTEGRGALVLLKAQAGRNGFARYARIAGARLGQ